MDPLCTDNHDKIQSILIIGAGLAGLTAAIALQKAKFNVTVLEKADALYELGAGIQIPPNCSRVLEALGVLDTIQKSATAPHNLTIWSFKGDKLHTQTLNHRAKERRNSPHLVIHRADFIRILYEEALQQGVSVELNCRVDNIDFASGSVMLHTGKTLQADLVLGADGEHSLCRDLLQGPSKSLRTGSGAMAYRLMLPSSLLEADPVLHFLLQPVGIQAWYGPGSHAVTYYLHRDKTVNVVFTLPASTEVDTTCIGPQLADLRVLRKYFRGWDHRFQRLIEVASQAQCWNLFEYSIVPDWVHHSERFLLLGDAAHPVLPYVSQGAAIAIESAFILSGLLSRCSYVNELPNLLRVFVKSRYTRALRIRDWTIDMKDAFRLPADSAHHFYTDNFPYPLADQSVQALMWDFNAHEEIERLLKASHFNIEVSF